MNIHFFEGKFTFDKPEVKEHWGDAFPAVNIQQEIYKAQVWANANPKNTKKNWHRFLVNWLTKAQEKAPAKGSLGSQVLPETTRPVFECSFCLRSGYVSFNNLAYRCRCKNGDDMSDKVKRAPDEAYAPPKGVMDWLMEHPDPMTLFKGFRSTGGLLKSKNPEMYATVRQYFLDLLGKEKCIEIFNQTEKIDISIGKAYKGK